MTAIVGEGVTLRGIYDADSAATWNLSGIASAAAAAAAVSKAVSQDLTVANTAELCAQGAVILGNLLSAEYRVQEGITVGAVCREGFFVWEYTGADPALGQGVVGGATAGKVAGAMSADVVPVAVAIPNVIVVDVDTTAKTVTVLFS